MNMHYTDLRIYHIALELAGQINLLMDKIPHGWRVKEVDQILRASNSVHANLVEGWSRRFYRKDFVRFLSYSLGSSDEIQSHIAALYKHQKISRADTEKYWQAYCSLSVKILNYINYQKKRFNIQIQPKKR